MRHRWHDMAWHGANYASPYCLNRLRGTKMARLGTSYCGTLRQQCDACLNLQVFLLPTGITYACVGSTTTSCGELRPVVTTGFQKLRTATVVVAQIKLNSPSAQYTFLDDQSYAMPFICAFHIHQWLNCKTRNTFCRTRSLSNANFSFLITWRSPSSKSAAVYKILWKSDYFSLRYGDISIFKMAAVRHLGIVYHHTRLPTKSLLLAAAACQISCQSDTQL